MNQSDYAQLKTIKRFAQRMRKKPGLNQARNQTVVVN
jgi:hypothetical protein